jgi:cytochrome P450
MTTFLGERARGRHGAESQPLPPGPRISPVWQLLRYTHEPLSFLEACARRYGDPFTFRCAGFGTLVMLTDAEAIKDVFRGDPHILHSGEGNEFLSLSVGQYSVLVLDDEPHARQRRAQLPPLKGERMRAFFGAIQSATLKAVRAWPVGRPLEMVSPMRRITLRVILHAVLGLPPGPELEQFERLVERVLAAGRTRYGLALIPLVPRGLVQNSRWVPFFRQLRDLDTALFAFIDRRRRAPAAERGENVLADLLAATHEDGAPLSDQEIRDAVLTLLVAGHETTSLALAWALEQIVPRVDVMARITDELRRVTGGAPPQAEHLERLAYLDAAIRESLRVRTIIPFVVRKTKQPFVAGGREYPAGVLLCPCSHLVHRRPDLYPEPAKFRPERFLERKYAGHEWFPFGGGNRTCLGMAFALYEMKVVLGTLFTQVRLARPPGSRSAPVRRGIALAPDDGARVVVTGRP